MPFRAWIAGFLIAAGGFGPAVAGDQPDTVVAVQPGGPGVLTKCRDWLVGRSCHHYHHISLPSRVAVGDTITLSFGSSPRVPGRPDRARGRSLYNLQQAGRRRPAAGGQNRGRSLLPGSDPR